MAQNDTSSKLVAPGEKLGVIEAFEAGSGTYTLGGVIFSQILGEVSIDRGVRKIKVQPKTKGLNMPKKGTMVVGEILLTQEKMAHIKIWRVGEIDVKIPFHAIIHVSFASRAYTKSLREAFKPGDLIRARVIGDTNLPYQLTTADSNLGVVLASCSRCGETLAYDKGRLFCQRCGSVERRKLSEDYNKKF